MPRQPPRRRSSADATGTISGSSSGATSTAVCAARGRWRPSCVRPYLVEGALVLPSRTLAYGQCSAQGGRFLVTFSRLRLPDGSEAQFEGLAMDVTDGKPGLLASRRLSGSSRPDIQQSAGGDIARGAASTVLSAATGKRRARRTGGEQRRADRPQHPTGATRRGGGGAAPRCRRGDRRLRPAGVLKPPSPEGSRRMDSRGAPGSGGTHVAFRAAPREGVRRALAPSCLNGLTEST